MARADRYAPCSDGGDGTPSARYPNDDTRAKARAVPVTPTPWASPPGHAMASDRPTGPEPTTSPPVPGALPAYQEPWPGRPAGHPESGDAGSWPAPRNEPPDALIRLRFADTAALDRAGAAFDAGAGPAPGGAWSDPATLTLQISADAGIETLRAVLAVLDAAAVTAESLTVHTHELDDVLAAFTSLP